MERPFFFCLALALSVGGCASADDELEPPDEAGWTSVAEARSADSEGSAPVLQLYDVRDLVARGGDDAGAGAAFEAFAFETFIGELRANVAPDSWGDPANAVVRAQSGTLVVKHRPAVHRDIASYLDTLRRVAPAVR